MEGLFSYGRFIPKWTEKVHWGSPIAREAIFIFPKGLVISASTCDNFGHGEAIPFFQCTVCCLLRLGDLAARTNHSDAQRIGCARSTSQFTVVIRIGRRNCRRTIYCSPQADCLSRLWTKRDAGSQTYRSTVTITKTVSWNGRAISQERCKNHRALLQ